MNIKKTFSSLSFTLKVILHLFALGTITTNSSTQAFSPMKAAHTCFHAANKHRAAIASFFALSWYTYDSYQQAPLRWDWESIDTNNITFPKNFMWGVATSAHQVEGDCTNNDWAYYEYRTKDGTTCSAEDENRAIFSPAGNACDHWNRYKEDIQLIKKLGANTYRFSMEWSKIMPTENSFDEKALQHYQDVFQELVANDIKPCITLYHYTQPIWFMKKGGFEKTKNIQYFVKFCEKLFERFGKHVHLWFTFNAPSGVAYKSYLNEMMPPYKKDMQLAVEVLKNVLEAHVQVYRVAKKIEKKLNRSRPELVEGYDRIKIKVGILKNVYQLDAFNPLNPLDRLGSYMGHMLADTCIYNFFKTGTFSVWIPGKVTVYHTNKKATQSLDFIGLNYYSHAYIKNFNVVGAPNEIPVGKKNHTIYAEGLYRAIQELHKQFCSLPIYITENGYGSLKTLTDKENCERRILFLQRHWYAISQAIKNDYPVYGYIHWALMDNYEGGAYHKRYGLYHVDFETQKRTLKPSGAYFTQHIKRATPIITI